MKWRYMYHCESKAPPQWPQEMTGTGGANLVKSLAQRFEQDGSSPWSQSQTNTPPVPSQKPGHKLRSPVIEQLNALLPKGGTSVHPRTEESKSERSVFAERIGRDAEVPHGNSSQSAAANKRPMPVAKPRKIKTQVTTSEESSSECFDQPREKHDQYFTSKTLPRKLSRKVHGSEYSENSIDRDTGTFHRGRRHSEDTSNAKVDETPPRPPPRSTSIEVSLSQEAQKSSRHYDTTPVEKYPRTGSDHPVNNSVKNLHHIDEEPSAGQTSTKKRSPTHAQKPITSSYQYHSPGLVSVAKNEQAEDEAESNKTHQRQYGRKGLGGFSHSVKGRPHPFPRPNSRPTTVYVGGSNQNVTPKKEDSSVEKQKSSAGIYVKQRFEMGRQFDKDVAIDEKTEEDGEDNHSDKQKTLNRLPSDPSIVRILPRYNEKMETKPVVKVPKIKYTGVVKQYGDPPKEPSHHKQPPTTKPPCPPKPNRTFKHDEYLEGKKALGEHGPPTVKSTCSTFKGVQVESDESDLEEGEIPGSPGEISPKRSSSSSNSSVDRPTPVLPLTRPRQPPPPRPVNPPSRSRALRKSSTLQRGRRVQGGRPQVRKTSEEDDSHLDAHEPGKMKRHKSDECLYADPNVKTQIPYDEPCTSKRDGVDPHGVTLDLQGYAVPDLKSPLKRNYSKGRLTHSPALPDRTTSLKKKKFSIVREKVSEAYSVLRRPRKPDVVTSPAKETKEEDDSDSQVDLEEHKERMKHLASLKEKHYACLAPQSQKQQTAEAKHLFIYAVVVSLQAKGESYKPCVIMKHPEDADMNPTIPQFCFPDPEMWIPLSGMESEMFSFVLTDDKGMRHYGYCRRILPPGRGPRFPEVVCILSHLDAFNFYRKLLRELEEQRQTSLELMKEVLVAAYKSHLPVAGNEAWIRYERPDGSKDTLLLRRPRDQRLEQVTYQTLLKHMGANDLVKVFASILLERRLILTSNKLSVLSSCAHALVSLLYPFQWHHTYVPVLPECMLEVLASPVPYIMGVPGNFFSRLSHIQIEEVLIYDLDQGHIIQCQHDESRILPKKLQHALLAALMTEPEGYHMQNTMIFEAFLRFFVETVGHYTDFIIIRHNGQRAFQREMFYRAVSSRSIKMFLEWFIETHLFEVFITGKLEDVAPCPGLFEKRVEEYREEMAEVAPSLRDNMKDLGKRMKNFMLVSGEKLKKIFSPRDSNVYV